MSTNSELKPDYRKKNNSEIKGPRSKHQVTFKPNKANPEEEIYISLPN